MTKAAAAGRPSNHAEAPTSGCKSTAAAEETPQSAALSSEVAAARAEQRGNGAEGLFAEHILARQKKTKTLTSSVRRRVVTRTS